MNMMRHAILWCTMWVEFLPFVPRAAQIAVVIQLGIYIWIILLHSNVNDFLSGFHRVDRKADYAASKLIWAVLLASHYDFWDVGWIVEWCQRAVWSECTSSARRIPVYSTQFTGNHSRLKPAYKWSFHCESTIISKHVALSSI